MKQARNFFSIKTVSLFIILSMVIVLFLNAVCLSQQGDEKIISLSTYLHGPQNAAAYDLIRTNVLFDMNDLNFYVDPTVQSKMHQIRVASIGAEQGDLIMTKEDFLPTGGRIYGISGENFYIDMNLVLFAVDFTSTAMSTVKAGMYIDSIRTRNFIFMGSKNPTAMNVELEGKHVYDIAEGMNVVDAKACDVVVISEDQDLLFIKSTRKFDTKVAGIVSEEPKLYMGAVTGLTPVALVGIVKCNVTAENGLIKRGDLLVSSSLAGHAMRADYIEITPGMVIGSALEGLEQDRGKIYILVN